MTSVFRRLARALDTGDHRTLREQEDDSSGWYARQGGVLAGCGLVVIGAAVLSGAWGLILVGLLATGLGVGFILRRLARRTLGRKLLWLGAYVSVFFLGLGIATALDGEIGLLAVAAAVVLGAPALADRLAPENRHA